MLLVKCHAPERTSCFWKEHGAPWLHFKEKYACPW